MLNIIGFECFGGVSGINLNPKELADLLDSISINFGGNGFGTDHFGVMTGTQ